MALTDSEILDNYVFAGSNAIDEGEEINCASCGRRYTMPGTPSNAFSRVPNKATRLPSAIDLCEFCAERLFPRS